MEMRIASIHVSENKMEVNRERPVTSGMVGATVEFAFDPEWDGLAKTAVFTAGAVTKDVVDIAEVVEIPHEVMAKPGLSIKVGVYGTNADGTVVIPTVYGTITYTVLNGADPSGDPSADPTLPPWVDLRNRVEKLENNSGAEIDPEAVEKAVTEYLEENPPSQGAPGKDGADGGYYTPTVTQPTADTMRVDFVASKTEMPAVAPVTIDLPVSSDNSQNADWNQNDPSFADYVKNRTHYKELVYPTLLDNVEFESDGAGTYYLYLTFALYAEEAYKMSVNGGELLPATLDYVQSVFTCGDYVFTYAGPSEISNAKLSIVANEAPIVYLVRADDEAMIEKVHPLDEAFIPDTIARKSDIPTDDHINSLINTALGVIENGTY